MVCLALAVVGAPRRPCKSQISASLVDEPSQLSLLHLPAQAGQDMHQQPRVAAPAGNRKGRYRGRMSGNLEKEGGSGLEVTLSPDTACSESGPPARRAEGAQVLGCEEEVPCAAVSPAPSCPSHPHHWQSWVLAFVSCFAGCGMRSVAFIQGEPICLWFRSDWKREDP